jgi:hypothetical protein
MTNPREATEPAKFWGRNGAGDGYRAATVCRNGHEQSISDEAYPGAYLGFCPCSEEVLGACPRCGRRLRGASTEVTLRVGSRPAPYQSHKWNACDGCGEVYPWASRDARISYLLRQLRAQDLDEHDRVALTDDLLRLRALEPGQDSETEGRVMAASKKGWFGFGSSVLAEALGGLLSEGVLSQFS